MRIFCDESGYSGENLLDSEQPFFTFASNNFEDDEAKDLITIVSSQAPEAKFSNLKKTPSGINKLLRFFSDPRLNNNRVIISCYDKKFFVISKLVDLVIEPCLHIIGENLYKGANNRILAHLLYYSFVNLHNEELITSFFNTFIKFIQIPTLENWKLYQDTGDIIVRHSKDKGFNDIIHILTEPRFIKIWYSKEELHQTFDPLVPAIFENMAHWGERLDACFDVFTDDSNALKEAHSMLSEFLYKDGVPPSYIGAGDRKIKFPLMAQSINYADSQSFPQIQIADLCAGLYNYFYKHKTKDDKICNLCRQLDWDIYPIIPEPLFTHKDLNVNPDDDFNIVDPIAQYLADSK